MRTIIFAQINDQKEDIMSLLTGTGGQLALSDEQIQEINAHLLVRNMEEFAQKFLPEQRGKYAGDRFHTGDVNDKESQDAVGILAHHLEKHAKNQYEVWRPRKSEKAYDEIPGTVCSRKKRIQQEIVLGVQAFFRQAGIGQKNRQAELLIVNISVKELLAHPEKCAVFETYLDTVNHKMYTTEQVAYAVLPEVSCHAERGSIRERFPGSSTAGEGSGPVLTADVERLLTVLGRHNVLLLYQYETGAGTSAKAFAANGVLPYQRAAAALEKHAYAASVSCCYPNLTAPQEGLYIGAAYVAAALLSSGAGEGSVTAFPKELYPYGAQAREDIARAKYGCLFASETSMPGWGAEPHMVMLSSRACRYEQGTYMMIKARSKTKEDSKYVSP